LSRGAEQHAFRKELEALLRCGEADAALASVRERMAALAGAGLPIIDLALRADPETVSLKGWDKLDDTIASEEKSGKTITAIGIDFSWPGHVDLKPDSNGSMPPDIETNYYTDQPDVRFSQATRAEILAGYSNYGSCWQGCFAEIDNAIEVEGMSALYGAVTAASIALSKHMEFENGDFNVQVDTPGGHLMVKFHKSENLFSGVWLCGPAKEVFKGSIDQSN
jgi:hypothetical protein